MLAPALRALLETLVRAMEAAEAAAAAALEHEALSVGEMQDALKDMLQRCGLTPGANGEPAPPCPAFGWPACDVCADICDPLGVRMQVKDHLADEGG